MGHFIDTRDNIVEAIEFLDADHAVVWTTVRLRDGLPLPVKLYGEGRSVRLEDVARHDLCPLGAAGVAYPPAHP